jgi:hypothetical protein
MPHPINLSCIQSIADYHDTRTSRYKGLIWYNHRGIWASGIRISVNISVFQTEETSSTLVSRTIRLATLTHGKPVARRMILSEHSESKDP